MHANVRGLSGRRRRGAVAVVMTICLVPLIGVLAFALDGGLLVAQRRRAQTVADASAHAAATSLYSNYSTNVGLDPLGKAAALALTIASANGYTNDDVTSAVKVNIPPQSGTFFAQPGYAEVIVTYYQSRIFSAIFGSGVLPVYGRAVARGIPGATSSPSVILLSPTGSGALSVSGSGHIVASNAIDIDSNNPAAAIASNAGYAKASAINIVGNSSTSSGGYFTGTLNPSSSAVADPLSTLAAPSKTGLTTQPSLPGYGSYTMSPGIYNGGVSLGGGMTVMMLPGTYYMSGGGFNVANGATLTGGGVFIYLDSSGGSISFQGGGNINLSPPTSGTYSGISFFQDRANSTAISIANGSTNIVGGTVYAPAAAANFAGGSSNQFGSQFISSTMNISNNANISVTTSGSGVTRKRQMNLVE